MSQSDLSVPGPSSVDAAGGMVVGVGAEKQLAVHRASTTRRGYIIVFEIATVFMGIGFDVS